MVIIANHQSEDRVSTSGIPRNGKGMTVVGSHQDQGIFFFFLTQGGLDGMNRLGKGNGFGERPKGIASMVSMINDRPQS